MVYFECQKCNESLKKPKVAKHLMSCGSHYITCIDCSTVFGWDTWEAHTSCVSEAQKYQGKDYQAKENTNKGQVKQDAWVDNVQKKIEDPEAKIAPQIKGLLEKLLGFSNIPRKQKPFGNFVKNSLKIWNDKQINEMWEVIQSANAAAKAPPPATTPPAAGAAGGAGVAKTEQCWAGWKRALDDELEAAGGSMPWKRLRDALAACAKKNGQANGDGEDALGYQALASIPEEYLSNKDELVRLPSAS